MIFLHNDSFSLFQFAQQIGMVKKHRSPDTNLRLYSQQMKFLGGERTGYQGVNVACTIPSSHHLVVSMSSHFIAKYTI